MVNVQITAFYRGCPLAATSPPPTLGRVLGAAKIKLVTKLIEQKKLTTNVLLDCKSTSEYVHNDCNPLHCTLAPGLEDKVPLVQCWVAAGGHNSVPRCAL